MSMSDHDDENPSGGYWPSVTDLFMTLFIISIAILAAIFFVLLPKNNMAGPDPVRLAVGKDFIHIIEPTNLLRKELGLQPVEYRSADQAIRDLTETCNEAVQRIRANQEKISQLQHDIEQLMKLVPGSDVAAKLQKEIARLEKEIAELKKQIKELQGNTDIAELQLRIQELERQLKENNVNVVIDERRKEFRFDSGSPVISSAFSTGLVDQVFPELADEILKRQERVDTLEIIGHTDGIPLSGSGNLDQRLPDLLAGDLSSFHSMTAGSNNDLGLLRALALKAEWLKFVDSKIDPDQRRILRGIAIRCYSAGQTILPDPNAKPSREAFRVNDPSARRIEMRLTRLGKAVRDSSGG